MRTREKKHVLRPALAPHRPRHEIDLAAIERLASIQCTDEEIAAVLGVSTDTIGRRKLDDPEFAKALFDGRSKGRATLRRLQWQRANAGSDTMMIWLGKQTLGQRDRFEADVNHHVTSTTATDAALEAIALGGRSAAPASPDDPRKPNGVVH